MTNSDPPVVEPAQPWRNRELSPADRVEALLREMTLEEKIAQLGSRWALGGASRADTHSPDQSTDSAPLNVAPMQDVFTAGDSLALEEASENGLGHLTRVYGSVPLSATEGAAELVR